MNTSFRTSPALAQRKSWLFLLLAALVAVVLAGLVWVASGYFKNYAEQTAKPLENALVQAGAVKKCSRGDSGRGPDNNAPWYEAYFELAAGRETATTTIQKIANSNGYNLKQASSADRGPVQVDDAYVGNWFYNTAPKESPYDDLLPGNIELFFTLNNDGPTTLTCDNSTKGVKVNTGKDVSLVGVRTKLPDFKR